MKLSEAIRLGAMMKPQCWDTMFGRNLSIKGELIATSCALGAALDAIGLHNDLDTFGDCTLALEQRWPILRMLVPEAGRSLLHEITNRNDRQRWTREAIADWVQKLESVVEFRRNTLENAGEMACVLFSPSLPCPLVR